MNKQRRETQEVPDVKQYWNGAGSRDARKGLKQKMRYKQKRSRRFADE